MGLLFKLLHGLLLTQDRILRFKIKWSDGICQNCDRASDSLIHAFFECDTSKEVGLNILESVSALVSNLTSRDVMFLQFGDSFIFSVSLLKFQMLQRLDFHREWIMNMKILMRTNVCFDFAWWSHYSHLKLRLSSIFGRESYLGWSPKFLW